MYLFSNCLLSLLAHSVGRMPSLFRHAGLPLVLVLVLPSLCRAQESIDEDLLRELREGAKAYAEVTKAIQEEKPNVDLDFLTIYYDVRANDDHVLRSMMRNRFGEETLEFLDYHFDAWEWRQDPNPRLATMVYGAGDVLNEYAIAMKSEFPLVGIQWFAKLRLAIQNENSALLETLENHFGSIKFGRLEAAAETFAQLLLKNAVAQSTGLESEIVRDFIMSSRDRSALDGFQDRVGQGVFNSISLELLKLQWSPRGIDRYLVWHSSSASAQHAVGLLYLEGVNGGENHEKAVEFFKAAAEQGDESARTALYAVCEQRYPPLACEGVPRGNRGLLGWLLGS